MLDSMSSPDWAEYARELGHRLGRLRIERSLTQQDVADRAGIARFTYQRYEQGKSQNGHPANPSLATLIALSQALEVSITELLPSNTPDLTTR